MKCFTHFRDTEMTDQDHVDVTTSSTLYKSLLADTPHSNGEATTPSRGEFYEIYGGLAKL